MITYIIPLNEKGEIDPGRSRKTLIRELLSIVGESKSTYEFSRRIQEICSYKEALEGISGSHIDMQGNLAKVFETYKTRKRLKGVLDSMPEFKE
ncbi:MAG: hypothetical protein AABW81_02690 [Nanoarchaeota archaeon]